MGGLGPAGVKEWEGMVEGFQGVAIGEKRPEVDVEMGGC